MDVGTGGGFPGLLLAIQHTTCDFILLDGVGKKMIAVADMSNNSA
jgi:16S rRNA (guanine527-N7)-methyltransferase